MKTQLTIIVTAVGSPPGVSFIRELRKKKVRIIGTDADSLSAGFRFCDGSYVIPRGDNPDFIKEIVKIAKKEKAQAIISGPEEELLVLSKNKNKLEKIGLLVLAPDFGSVSICADKKKTSQFFEKIGIPAPRIFHNKVSATFPCMVKERFGRGGNGVFKVHDKNELKFYLKKVKQPIIQEFIEGVEYTVDILSDLSGKPFSVIPRIRIQTESGISIKGKTVYDRQIIDYCAVIAEKLKLIGPSCIQCIKNKKVLKFIEINTRFGGGSILSAKADPTVIPNLLRIIKKKKLVKSSGFKRNITMLRYFSEIYDYQP